MKFRLYTSIALLSATISLVACQGNNAPKAEDEKISTSNIKEEKVTYKSDTVTLVGYVTYDENIKGKRPAVLIAPEWWGLGDYTRGRAKQLAELGYIAMAIDTYGDAKQGEDPKAAGALATPFYKDPTLCKTRLDAAIAELKIFAQTDTANMAAIGYCYGGFVVLNAAKLGADLKGVVSFHGGLAGAPINKDLLKAKILVCHGGADNFESPEEIAAFKKGMDSVGADYSFKVYANATHAFTNPEATENGKKFSMPIEYNAAADTASWNDMKDFFKKIFPATK